MTIKSWESRTTPNTTLGEQLVLMQNETNELRAALAERDDEIAELKNRLHDANQSVGNLEAVIKAQRKVLEQSTRGFDLSGHYGTNSQTTQSNSHHRNKGATE